MTASVFPNANERVLVLGIFRQAHCVLGVLHRMMIDGLDHVAGLEAGLGGGGIGLYLGDDRPLTVSGSLNCWRICWFRSLTPTPFRVQL